MKISTLIATVVAALAGAGVGNLVVATSAGGTRTVRVVEVAAEHQPTHPAHRAPAPALALRDRRARVDPMSDDVRANEDEAVAADPQSSIPAPPTEITSHDSLGTVDTADTART